MSTMHSLSPDLSIDTVAALETMTRSGVGWPCFERPARLELQGLSDTLLRLIHSEGCRHAPTVITAAISHLSPSGLEALALVADAGATWTGYGFDRLTCSDLTDIRRAALGLLADRRRRFIRSVTGASARRRDA